MNICTMIGRLVRDPDIKTATSGTVIGKFTLAVNRGVKREGEPDADFFDVVVFGKTAEFAGKYFSKGRQVAVNGAVRNTSWEDKDGNRKHRTEIYAEHLYFADTKPSNASEPKEQPPMFGREIEVAASKRLAVSQPAPQATQTAIEPTYEAMSDDDQLPF